MHLYYPNVNHAFRGLVLDMNEQIRIHNHPEKTSLKIVATPSRYGDVYAYRDPVTVTYVSPTQRVLFNEGRDCNPFFHLFESIWMLAGRQDVDSLAYFLPRMREFSDDGETFHGAYGYRWRHQFGYDQLKVIIEELKKDPTSRRCVIQMWDASDIERIYRDEKRHDLWTATHGGKDVPCNTQAYFRVVNDRLDMTVTNRSNDMVWGMLGANVVHFSYLQEYVANCIKLPVGYYHQFTNNLHVYKKTWTPEKWKVGSLVSDLRFAADKSCPIPLVEDPDRFFDEANAFIDGNETLLHEPYLARVVSPMVLAFRHHKERDYQRAFEAVNLVLDEQWSIAGKAWLRKREENWRKKNGN